MDYLTSEFGISEERVRSQLEKTTYQYIVMDTDIEDDQAKEIRSFISENKLSYALYLSPTTKRYYPYSATAAHVIGFLGYTEDSGDQKVGAYGVEANYEETLAGQSRTGGDRQERLGYGDALQLPGLYGCGRRQRHHPDH